MTLVELKQSIHQKNFSNLYVFYGPEYYILETYIDMICKGSEYNRIESDSVLSIYKNLQGNNLFQKKSNIYVVRNDKEFLTAENVWDSLLNRLKKTKTILIVKYSDIDQRSKFFKKFSDMTTEFMELSEEVLTKYIQKKITIKKEYCQYLISLCGKGCGRLFLETDKVENLSQYCNISHEEAFRRCCKEHAFHIEPEGEVFDLVDGILLRDAALVYDLLEESKRRSDNQLLVLSLLHNNVKAILQLQLIENKKDISQTTGLTGFQIKNATKYINKYTSKELIRFMKYIRYCEKSVKQGLFSADFVLDYLLVNIL